MADSSDFYPKHITMLGKKFNELKSNWKHSEKRKKGLFSPPFIYCSNKRNIYCWYTLQLASTVSTRELGRAMELLYLLVSCYSLYQQSSAVQTLHQHSSSALFLNHNKLQSHYTTAFSSKTRLMYINACSNQARSGNKGSDIYPDTLQRQKKTDLVGFKHQTKSGVSFNLACNARVR